ncbi:MAG: hypothetical protein IT342_25870 [Candidatus Melainabacteria bacterium]|nr:hypothetical protein [Candidatus Melainabacteria bacterium]
MARLENSEQKTFTAGGGLLDREGLSQSVQKFFQPIDRVSAGQQNLPWALDFGTGTDLYQSAAYTGERRSLSALMADEPEHKLDAPKIQTPSDALARPSVIRTKEDEAIWDEMQKPHKLGKHESATHIGLSTEVIADMQKKGQASKLEFFDSAAEGALAALQKPTSDKILIASNVDSNDANKVLSDMTRGGPSIPGTLLPESWMVELGTEFMGVLGNLAMNMTAAKFQEVFDAVKKAVVNPIEHPFRGQEMETLALVPENSWNEAYRAYPDLQKIGGLSESQSKILMKAIVGNELTFYGPEDKAQDAVCEAGQGHIFHGKTVGFAQIAPDGVRKLSAEFDKEIKDGTRTDNPLRKLAGLTDDELAKAMLKSENIPVLVGAVISHNVRMFDRHKNEVDTNPLTLGYGYNPDHVFAKSDHEHKHLMTKKEAEKKSIPYDPALPTKHVLSVSEHAHNIAKWLQKLGG